MLISFLIIRSLKNMYLIFLLQLLSTSIQSQNIEGCALPCLKCLPFLPICYACKDGFQLTSSGQCDPSSNVENCQIFGPRRGCAQCKPSYRLNQFNRCEKMYDGCLISDRNGMCLKCIYGGIINKGQCDTRFLNCKKIVRNKCQKCRLPFPPLNGRCIENDSNCVRWQPNLGLCTECKEGYELIGYNCLSVSLSKNCYYSSLFLSSFVQCKYCKPGYQLSDSICKKTIQDITNQWKIQYPRSQLVIKNCPNTHYFNYTDSTCRPIPQRCQKFDYGRMRCSFCKQNNILFDNDQCIDQSIRYCQNISNSSLVCLKCEPFSYLTSSNLCNSFPPYCIKVQNQQCVECQSPFLLDERGCFDGNCQYFQTSSTNCIKCREYYQKDFDTGICKFKDIYCEKPQIIYELGRKPKCLLCIKDFIFSEQQGLCVYNDPNCASTLKRNYCQICKNGFYFSSKDNKCVLNPQKCATVANNGDCTACFPGFSLNQNKQCQQVGKNQKCQIISQKNPKQCQKCRQKHYLDPKLKICLPFPILCLQYDPIKNMCQKCDKDTQKKGGLCYHVKCQYFDINAQCLGCKFGHQLTPNGECISEKRDQNCKQFSNGQCKVCSDRFYFNKQERCVDVSAFCKNYSYNNGQCTQCYGGYILQDGQCINQSSYRQECAQTLSGNQSICIKCRKYYQLNPVTNKCIYNQYGCIQKSAVGCIKCKQQYILDKNNRVCLKVQNKTNLILDYNSSSQKNHQQFSDPNCHLYNSNRTQCIKCNGRNYLNKKQNKCVEIDKNCNTYDPNTGVCNSCFKGFTITADKMGCQIEKPKDPYCKVFIDDTTFCKECYSGYFFSKEKMLCVQDYRNCDKTDKNNEFCISCWSGYILKQGKCVIESSLPITQSQSPFTRAQLQSQPLTNVEQIKIKNCLKFDKTLNKCLECIKNTVFDLQTMSCEYPLKGIDQFCVQYRNKECSRCTNSYNLINFKCQDKKN